MKARQREEAKEGKAQRLANLLENEQESNERWLIKYREGKKRDAEMMRICDEEKRK